ncbi:unnamed protein product [Prorocentrum cordatum]|uniref:Ubiquitin-like protease family profile domain-containing protein n=1 Tax=Prorocentrum cordatum TaxID=2364126 RepID=A0ABN9XDJ6_9DINO|nr:unnamed protein product [Polarella glacialis]
MALLQARPGGPRRWHLSSYFWPKLASEGPKSVRRWARRASVSVPELELMVIPMNVAQGTHWAVAAVAPGAGEVAYLDSLGMKPPEGLAERLREWYQDASGQAEPGLAPGRAAGAPRWGLLRAAVARQRNSWDCGPMACAFAERLAAGVPPAEAGGAVSGDERLVGVSRCAIAVALLRGWA